MRTDPGQGPVRAAFEAYVAAFTQRFGTPARASRPGAETARWPLPRLAAIEMTRRAGIVSVDIGLQDMLDSR